MIFPGHELITALEYEDDNGRTIRQLEHIKALAKDLIKEIDKEINHEHILRKV